MQKISFGDKEYVKAAEIAKQFKYTQDYVGQLCRGKKVDARLVGRTWYVVADSVKQYRKTKHTTQKTAASTAKAPVKKRTDASVTVVPVLRGKTARMLRTRAATAQYAAQTQTLTPVYSADETTSIPVMDSAQKHPVLQTQPPQQKPKKLKVVTSSNKKTKLTTEKISEISLSAKLKVTDNYQIETPDVPPARAKQSLSEQIAQISATPEKSPDLHIPAQNTQTRAAVAGTPRTTRIRLGGRLVTLFISIAGIVIALLLVSGGYSASVSATGASSTWSFSFENITNQLLGFF